MINNMVVGEIAPSHCTRHCTRRPSCVDPACNRGRMLGTTGDAMSRFSNSVSLVKSSWHVLSQDKELIALPAISGVVTAIAMIPFAAGAFLAGVSTTGDETKVGPISYVLAFLGYLVAAYVTIFFQSALILAANERLSGGSPTLGSALVRRGRPRRSHPAVGDHQRDRVDGAASDPGAQRHPRSHRHRPGGHGLDPGHLPGAADPGDRGHRREGRAHPFGVDVQAHLGRERHRQRRCRPGGPRRACSSAWSCAGRSSPSASPTTCSR